MFFLRWLTSRMVRRAVDLRQQVARLLNEQRDLLPTDAVEELRRALDRLNDALRRGAVRSEIEPAMGDLLATAEQRLLPYPAAGIRENVKEVFVAITVILSFTTFFLQLTKIPTGSMQPTLFGITYENLRGRDDVQIPNRLARFFQYWIRGVSYYELKAKEEGALREIEPPRVVLPFVKRQRLRIGERWYTIWFPPEALAEKARLQYGQFFKKGEDVIRLKVASGDHLMMDRFTYNFRRPQRGEIIVFKTRGILDLPQDQLYIKRLVALGGERVRIGDDQHLVIDGRRLDASTPRFEKVYTFDRVPREHGYFGHVNQRVANRFVLGSLARYFEDGNDEKVVPPGHYLAMGDNTMNSRDSRDWGPLPQRNVVGRCWFVYWPVSERFGWGVR